MADELGVSCPFSYNLVREPFRNVSGTVQDPFRDAGDSGTAPERLRNGSRTVPERFQNGSRTVPERFRNGFGTKLQRRGPTPVADPGAILVEPVGLPQPLGG